MAKGRNTQVIGARVPDKMGELIKERAQRGGMTVSQWALRAFEDRLRPHKPRKVKA